MGSVEQVCFKEKDKFRRRGEVEISNWEDFDYIGRGTLSQRGISSIRCPYLRNRISFQMTLPIRLLTFPLLSYVLSQTHFWIEADIRYKLPVAKRTLAEIK